MSEAAQARLTVICADAGYGKTTLVAEFVASSSFRTEWYRLTPGERDIIRFAGGLSECLQRLAVEPEPGIGGRVPVSRGGSSSLAVFTEMLLGDAARVGPGPAYLILEDYQNVGEQADVNALLGAVIEGSPPCLHFLVLTRSMPRLHLARLRARQELSILGEEDLSFTLEETSRFLLVESGLNLDDSAISLMYERTEGWAAGIAMVSQSLRCGRVDKVMNILAEPEASAWLVFDYLAEEVFDRQEPAIQDFLVKTSVLKVMSAPICDHLLGTAQSQKTLLALVENGLFTTSADLSKRAFRYHQLFRETLRHELYQREGREGVERLHLQAAQFYESRSEWEECVHHYLKAGDAVKAATIIESIGERYAFSGYFQTLDYWLNALPAAVISARPWLIVLRARLSHLQMRHEEALRDLHRALALFHDCCDEGGEAWTIGYSGYMMYLIGQVHQSLRQFSSALDLVSDRNVLKSEILVMQARALLHGGMPEKAIEACRASMAEISTGEPNNNQSRNLVRAGYILGTAQMEMGNIDAALQTLREDLDLCRKREVGENGETSTLARLGAILWARGDLDEAIEVLNRALSMSGRYMINQQHVIGLWLGNSLRDKGRYAEADQAYERSVPAGKWERIFLAIVAGRAKSVRHTAANLYSGCRQAESVILRSTAEVVMGAVLRECREQDEALAHLREGIRTLRTHGFRLRLASALLHQSRVEYDLSRPSDARESLSEALRLAETEGYYHFFWWDRDLITLLCQKALSEGILPDYVGQLVVQSLGSRGTAVLVPLLHDRRAEVRRRAHGLMASLPQGGPGSQDEVLAGCTDLRVRESVAQAIDDGLLSQEGVQLLRTRFDLSLREVEILTEYYLRPAAGPAVASTQLRKECSLRLNISENTVRCHVNNIRRKLTLPDWATGAHVLDWMTEEGLLLH